MKDRVNPNLTFSLLDPVLNSLGRVHPQHLFRNTRLEPGEAVLCWGKAATATFQSLQSGKSYPGFGPDFDPGFGDRPSLVISPDEGEHPLPGPKSFASGEALLEFFDFLRRSGTRKLRVFLSGGASSLAWLPPVGLSRSALWAELSRLYALPLDIQELNRRRARLCLLKSGGSAELLAQLAPRVRARVEVISDVAPFSASVVGSGPFWNGKIPHHVVADNPRWISEIKTTFERRGIEVLSARSACTDPWPEWVKQVSELTQDALSNGRTGLIVLGGEPKVRLRKARGTHKSGFKGGRQTQIAAALLGSPKIPEIHEALKNSRLEILCLASDGVDGASDSSGAFLTARVARKLTRARLPRFREELSAMNSAGALARLGALLPAWNSGTNAQDAVFVWIKS